ncbi:MAG: multicopper oxidase family protein [Desulfobacteria bacterium]
MGRKGLSRREFIRFSSLVVGAGYLGANAAKSAAGMMGGGGGMGGGTSVIDPPPGALFRDPPVAWNKSTAANIVEVDLEAGVTQVNVNGTMANLLTYNGGFPGPTIRVRNSDTLKINLTNSLSMLGTNILGHDRDITNLHTHGLHVSPEGNSDNVMRMLMSGDTFNYEYDLSKQAAGTLNFYHPHVHGSVAEQYWGGLAGALIVEDDLPVLSGFETHLMILKDIALSGADPEPYTSTMDFMHGKVGDTAMVNGQVNPVLNIRPGQVQRWRVLNASNARFYMLSLEGHALSVVGTEGGLLDKPYPQPQILLSPGERVEILVKASRKSGSYRLLSLPYNRGGGSMGQQVTLLTLSYKGSRTSDAVPSVIDPEAVRVQEMPMATRTLALSMGQGKGYINGISFAGMDSTFEIHSMLGTWEIWRVVNQSMMDHPFHQHVNPCQVLSISGGDAGYASLYTSAPAWKDVVLIPKMGSATLLVPVMDYGGMSMFHCHIVEHEDIGMMGLWHIGDHSM